MRGMVLAFGLTLAMGGALGQSLPVDDAVLEALATETSGESAKRNLDRITLYHRTRASSQFRAAAEHIRDQLQRYGYADARILEYPADGVTMFGTQKSRMAWQAESAQLWEVDAQGARRRRLADWESVPLSLAQDSVSGATRTTLVDVGAGTDPADYEGKHVRGKLVLTEGQPEAVVSLAVGRYGAAGIVSYAPNQRSAWWKEDSSLVRWGHLPSFPERGEETFAFMISLAEARALQQRMAAGESIHLDAQVKARRELGVYSLVEAVIPGADAAVAQEQIVLTCHLDHPRPGANDNASGCVAILEAARTLKRLLDEGRVPAPRRSIRFVFPAEIEGTLIYLNADPELAGRIKANIHMDMVGGNANTKAVFRLSTGPFSLPSIMADLGHAIVEFVNARTLAFAASGTPDVLALVAPEGEKSPLQAEVEGLELGSDNDVYREGSFRIPGFYLHDWPDRYIHTDRDTAANIDPTKLKRSAFIGAVAAWYLAALGENDVAPLLSLLQQGSLRRAAELVAARRGKSAADAAAITRAHWAHESSILDSVTDFAPVGEAPMAQAKAFVRQLAQQIGGLEPAPPADSALTVVYTRNPALRGTMDGFGYSYLDEKLGAAARKALPLQDEAAYEALNLVDGTRSVAEIHEWMLAAFGASNAQEVLTYLQALERVGVVRSVKAQVGTLAPR
jgi:aminopeptidase YwaD